MTKSKTDKIVILDMDETLIHTVEDQDYEILKKIGLMENPKYQAYRDRVHIFKLVDIVSLKGQGFETHMWAILRPGLKEFLIFCCQYFQHVIIWSAGLQDYVVEIITSIFDPLNGICQPAKIWTRKDCESIKIEEEGDFGDVGDSIDSKPISKIAKALPQLNISLENTWIVDDRLDNFYCNPNNGILIPAYRPRPSILGISRTSDDALKKLTEWWDSSECRKAKDVRKLDTSKIF